MKYFLTSLFYLIMFSCNRSDDKYIKFVKVYNNENFDEFKNTTIFIRSFSISNEEVIFSYDETISPDLNNGAYVITIDDKAKSITSTSCHLMKDSTIINKKKLERLALKFIEYKVGYLSVDSIGNVLVNLTVNGSPDLVRFLNIKHKTTKYADWKQVKDNWYRAEGAD